MKVKPVLKLLCLWIFSLSVDCFSVISEECSNYDNSFSSAEVSRTKSVADRTVKLKLIIEPERDLVGPVLILLGLSESKGCESARNISVEKCRFIRTDGKARIGPVFMEDHSFDKEDTRIARHLSVSPAKLQCSFEFSADFLSEELFFCLKKQNAADWSSVGFSTKKIQSECKIVDSKKLVEFSPLLESSGKNSTYHDKTDEALDDLRSSRQVRLPSTSVGTIAEDDDIDYIPGSHLTDPLPDVVPAVIHGIRVDEADKGVEYTSNGGTVILAGADALIRLFGSNFTNHTQIKFVFGSKNRSEPCSGDMISPVNSVQVLADDLTDYSAKIRARLPLIATDAGVAPGDPLAFSICTYYRTGAVDGWIHQGRDPWLYIYTFSNPIPFWLQITLIVLLLVFSGLFSGLNLGLMSLDRTELQILVNTGTDAEKRYANAIIPVRNHGNYLLCTLLLGNVLVNSTLTILLDDMSSGIVAVVGSTLGIVIFGEIVPQAICSRFGLAVGAHTIWVTKFFMLLTFPLSFPVSKLLDCILGEEIGAYYNRERLKELIRVTQNLHGLERDEVNIIAGALEMKRKIVADVMTKIEDVFMLSEDALLDFDTVTEIVRQGYSRVPVYSDADRRQICGIIFTKDLALLDTDDRVPIKRFCKFYQHDLNFVYEDVTLDVMFSDFKQGTKGHMAFVQRVNAEGEGDPFYETIGLVTLEDVIEEMIQSEIIDETDVWEDNRHRKKRTRTKKVEDFSPFAPKRDQSFLVSPQLTLAAFQFLSTSVDPFTKEQLSESVLRRLMLQPIIRHIKVKDRDKGKNDPYTILYSKGKPADYFILLLDGHVEVIAGKENLVFESGPFTYYGLQALTGSTVDSPSLGLLPNSTRESFASATSQNELAPKVYVPDYTVRAVTDVTFLRVKRGLYLAARAATELERKKDTVGRSMDLESELDKVLDAGNEESERNNANSGERRFNSRPGSKRNSAILSDVRVTPDGSNLRSPSKLNIPLDFLRRQKSASASNSLSASAESLVEQRDRSSSVKTRQSDAKDQFTISLPLAHMNGSAPRMTSRTSTPILSPASKNEDPPPSYGSFDSVPSVRNGTDNPSDSSQYESAVDDKTTLLKTSPV